MCDKSLIDECRPDILLERVNFGSCAKQYLSQIFWNNIKVQHSPQLWIYAGDAYYSNSPPKESWTSSAPAPPLNENLDPRSLEALTQAQTTAMEVAEFKEFRNSLDAGLVGTFDDHDYGINDGGGGTGYTWLEVLFPWYFKNSAAVSRERRKNIFLDFLQLEKSTSHPRRMRQGVYASHLYGRKESDLVKVILLDTRFARDEMQFPSYGRPFLGAILRFVSAATGLVNLHQGRLLGEDQWDWLEKQLEHSRSVGVRVNILVSSIQVFTSNPLVESWGHFPAEKRRLQSLLSSYRPNGLVVLSGDIHSAELIRAGTSSSEAPSPLEVTSSGLTHDCASGVIPRWLCRGVLDFFDAHRPSSNDPRTVGLHGKETVYTRRNFGSLQVDREHGVGISGLRVSVHDLETGEDLFGFQRGINETDLALPTSVHGNFPGFSIAVMVVSWFTLCFGLLSLIMIIRKTLQRYFNDSKVKRE